MKGSPTCIVVRTTGVARTASRSSFAANSSLAIVAPWMPSRPVLAPM